MVIDKIEMLLNDGEVNLLADLFLAHYGFDRSSIGYRYFRNAVIVASHGLLKPTELYSYLAAAADTDVETFITTLTATLRDLPEPIHSVFNRVFAPAPDSPPVAHLTMKATNDLSYIIYFLGTAFLYLILRNYPEYEHIKLALRSAD